MCGIIVGNTKEKFIKTYEQNRERGDFSFGAVFAKEKQYHIARSVKCHVEDIPEDADIYLGHARAPTCNHEHGFDPINSHPFESLSWIVGHNGIIKNFEKLKNIDNFPGVVDSSIIPHLFDLNTIDKALERLEGIFGIWAYHKTTGDVLVARCASTLYYNKDENIISSAKIDNSELLDEGIIYQWHKDKPLTEIATFEYDSPYLIL